MAEEILRSLVTTLRLSADTWNNDIKAAQREAKAFENNLKPTVKLAEDLGKAMSVAGIAIVGAFTVAIKAAADYGDEINDAAKRTGVTTEQLSKLRLAAETSGSSFDGLTTGLKFLAKNMELANSGSTQQVAAFRAAGISAKDLKEAHGDVNVVLQKLADTFASSEDGAGKTAIAMALLGKSGSDLIPTLNEGSAGLKKWGDEAERAGRVVSAEAGKAADEFNDRLRVLQVSVLGLTGSIGNSLIPVMTKWISEGTKVVQQVREWTAENKTLTDALGATGLILAGAGGITLSLAALPGIIAKVRIAFAALFAEISAMTLGLAALLAAIIYFRREIAEGLLAALATATDGLKDFLVIAALVADKVGLNGLGLKLHDAAFSVGSFSKELEDSVTLMMKEADAAGIAADQLRAQGAGHAAAADGAKKHTLALEENAAAQAKLKDAQKLAYKEAFEASEKAMKAMKEEGDNAINYWTTIYQKSLEAKIKALDTIQNIIDRNNDQLARSLDQQASDYDRWLKHQSGVYIATLDDEVKAKEDQIKQIKDAEKDNADFLNKQYRDTFNSVKSTATKVFTDMIQDGKLKFGNLADSIKGIFNTLWTEILGSLTAKLLTPLVNAISNSIGGVIGKIPGLGGVFGGAAGAGLGSIFGHAGSSTQSIPATGIFTASAGQIAATAGIGAAVVAAIAFVKSQAHHEADTFVKDVQNPFGEAIGKISDAFSAAERSGNLTIDAATKAETDVKALWQTFQDSAHEFATHGSDEAKVAGQALAQLTPFMTQFFADMDKSVMNLNDNAEALKVSTEAAAAVAADLQVTQDYIRKVTDATLGSSNLNQALTALESMGSPTALILDRLGGDIEEFYKVLLESGVVVPDLIQKYHDLLIAQGAEASVIGQATSSFPGLDGSRITASSAEEVRAFLNSLQPGQSQQINMFIDGQKIASAIAPHNYALARNQGVRIVGTR